MGKPSNRRFWALRRSSMSACAILESVDPKDSIQQLLAQKPGLKAQQIADELAMERAQVVGLLHGLEDAVVQDNSYRWWPRTRPRDANGTAAPRTLLANLCRYYLECLALESGAGISLPLEDTGGYVKLLALPFANQTGEPWAPPRAVRKLIQKVRRERGQLTLYLGYALRVRHVVARGHEETRVEPVLLYPIEETPDNPADLLRPASGIPLFNMDVLRSLPAADSGNVRDEAIHLSDELGLANAEDDLPPWDEIILRLQRSRPDWGWREPLNPYALSTADLARPGIYNQAVLFAGTRSPF